jgi:hypothetical protein
MTDGKIERPFRYMRAPHGLPREGASRGGSIAWPRDRVIDPSRPAQRTRSGPAFKATRRGALRAWADITKRWRRHDSADHKRSKSIADFLMHTGVAQAVRRHRAAQRQAELQGIAIDPAHGFQQARQSLNAARG